MDAAASRIAPQEVFPRWRARVAGLRPRQRDRLARVAAAEETRLDATHPPLAWRRRLLLGLPTPAALVLSDEDSAAIDRELAAFEPRVAKRLVDARRAATGR